MEAEPILVMSPMSANSPIRVSSCPTMFTSSPMITSNSSGMISNYATVVSNPAAMMVPNPCRIISDYSAVPPYHHINSPMISNYTTVSRNSAQNSNIDNWMVTVIGGSKPAGSNSSMISQYHPVVGENISTLSNSSVINSNYQPVISNNPRTISNFPMMVSSHPMITTDSHAASSNYRINSRYSAIAANIPPKAPNSPVILPSYQNAANSLETEDCTIISSEYPTAVADFVTVSNSSAAMVYTSTTAFSNPHTTTPLTVLNSHVTSSIAPSVAANSTFPSVATLVFFDLETTGLAKEIGKSNVHITELSLLAIDKKEFEESKSKDLADIRLVNKLSVCVKPRVHVSSGAAAVTGLDDEKLKNQQYFDEDLALMLCSFIKRLPKPVCLLAHNGNIYDFPLLRAELQRLNLQLPDDLFCADTLLAFRQLGLPGIDGNSGPTKQKRGKFWQPYSLLNLHLHFFKKKPVNGHHAEGDCQALMMVCGNIKGQFVRWIDDNRTLFSSVSAMW